ncbi:hypothetical protein MMAD_53370 [Mycolicibacterium madagascariense]|uniref:Uncharacterized protein n=1 Tax=Mycolicibacterium madagascariense TaxID=212765 RepID=A0A7I7XPV0_9MYCO|nr:MarR family transcriptional regulator [Mycolicibacterium madagascariense]MCV7014017.1 MarR family transcriptional regulator [Mycolicibacterium madagascariense]BBZ31042.1 hypothetical protein MMAD_53370 [Mycolicibacterium madagascariense]
MNELALLQTVRLKGRVPRTEVDADDLVAAGLLVDAPMVRLTEAGRARLADLLAAERATVDPTAADDVYARFTVVNAKLKPVISQWQLTREAAGPGEVAAVLAEVDRLHRDVEPVIEAAAALVPRLRSYGERLDGALQRARSDMSWLTRPIVDSYHTVWFELHEELIGLAGRTRAQEGD